MPTRNIRETCAAIALLAALGGHAGAQSFTIDPDGLGATNVTVDGAALTSLSQLSPGMRLRLGIDPVGSLLISGPWAPESFRILLGFSSTLRLEGGVELKDIDITSIANGGGSSTVPGRIELDGSSMAVRWNLPFPSDINSLEYQIENNSHLSIDFQPYNQQTYGWGRAPFEVGLTPETIVDPRPRDLRVTRVPTGSMVSIDGTTSVTRAGGGAVAASGHNIVIDGGTWETNRVTAAVVGDPALAEGGIDFRSGTFRIRDRYGFGFASFANQEWDVWDTDQTFNQDAMNAILAGLTPAGPAVPTLVAGQTLHFEAWFNPFWIGYSTGSVVYEDWANESIIAATLEIRGGRLVLGPEGGWESTPSVEWIGFPNIPSFEMNQTAKIIDGGLGNGEVYAGPDPIGPFVLDGGQFDFSILEFTGRPFGNNSTFYFPEFRAGAVRGFSLAMNFSNLPAEVIVLGAPGEVLDFQLSWRFSVESRNPILFPDGATVAIQSEELLVAGVTIGDGSSVTLDTLSVGHRGGARFVRIGLNSTLSVGRLGPLASFGVDAVPATLEIGGGSLAEVGGYSDIPEGMTALSTGAGTLRLLAGALDSLAPLRRAFTVGTSLELDPSGTLAFGLMTPTDATSYAVAGDLDVDSCGLGVTLADEFFIEGERVLVAVGGTVTGVFAGFPEGTLVESRLGVDLYLSYTGGDGNDIVLTTDGGCAADLTGDGLLDLSDINTFVQGFVAQAAVADLNGDGIFDLSDINAFVNAFVAGC